MRLLIVAADRTSRRALRQMLAGAPDLEVVEAQGLDAALRAVASDCPDVLLIDVRLGEADDDRGGLHLLARLRASGRSTPAVMLAAMPDFRAARDALRHGALDVLLPEEIRPDIVLPMLERIRERLRLTSEVARLRASEAPRNGLHTIVGSSPAMDRVRQRILRIAESDRTVLIRGETGTGKELVARAIHALGSRRDEPFLAVNCSALPGTLVESMIFGHERGAFTGAERRLRGQLELAGAGTVLLDEIAEMAHDLQAKLLRMLEDRSFRPLGSEVEIPLRARVLAATHVDLEQRIADGRFRQDLFYRLDVIRLDVPSLAERGDDLSELLDAFVADTKRPLEFAGCAQRWLARRRWPGNVRELRNVVERAALMSESDTIDATFLEEIARDRSASDPQAELSRVARSVLALPDTLGSKLRAIDRAVVREAIEAAGGNKTAAARLLGVDRKAIDRRAAEAGDRSSFDRISHSDVDAEDAPPVSSDVASRVTFRRG